MSEIKTLEVEVTHPDILDVDIDFGQTLTKIVAPEKYLGPFEFYPSDEDQIIPVKEKMPVEDIVVKAEEWDGILYPITDESDPMYSDKVFNAKHIPIKTGDRVIIEGYGRGRWYGAYNEQPAGVWPNDLNITLRKGMFDYLRFDNIATQDSTLVLAGYRWTRDGTHSSNTAYVFCGEYLKWKVIPAE